MNLQEIEATLPYYLYYPQNAEIRAEYDRGVPVPNILSGNSVGVATSRDRLAIHFTRQDLLRTVRDFAARDTENAREKYSLGKDVQDWRVAWAQEDVRQVGQATIVLCPFYTGHSIFAGRIIPENPAAFSFALAL